jgi:hypothetical protein
MACCRPQLPRLQSSNSRKEAMDKPHGPITQSKPRIPSTLNKSSSPISTTHSPPLHRTYILRPPRFYAHVSDFIHSTHSTLSHRASRSQIP